MLQNLLEKNIINLILNNYTIYCNVEYVFPHIGLSWPILSK
jgi:hypothetical protein